MMMPGMIQQAMAAGATPGGVPAGATPTQQPIPTVTDPKAAVRTVATAAGYTVAESAGSLQITVPIGAMRKQVVNVEFAAATDPAGHATINYWSVCGPYVEKNAGDLLRQNTDTLHGALAIKKVGETEQVVLQSNQLADTLTPPEISRALSAIAWQADQLEQKLTGGDQN
jgi:hypothetical protein